MTNAPEIIDSLQNTLENDQISLFYSGDFDDHFTEQLVRLTEHDTGKAIKKRLSYLMTESFQNVVRYGNETSTENSKNVFGVRGVAPFLHIFSSNPVTSEVRNSIEGNVSELNKMSSDELKEYYVHVLESEGFGDKGGAGLGLIDMIRKSKMPLQVKFNEIQPEVYGFNMQIDLLTAKDIEPTEVEPSIHIEENIAFNEVCTSNEIVFAYKGEFNDSFLAPMITVIEGNTGQSEGFEFLLNHCIVELMQNIARHGKKTEEGDDAVGVMGMSDTSNGYYLCTGNYTDADVSSLKAWVEEINSKNEDELNELYKVRLKESVKKDSNNAEVGLIDMRRVTGNPIDCEVKQDENGAYVVFGVRVSNK